MTSTPDKCIPLFQRGNDLLKQNRHVEAADSFRQALAIDPLMADIWHNLGHACRNHSPEEAEHAFRMAIKIAAGSSEFRNSLGQLYLETERLDEALACYREVLDYDSANVTALVGAGRSLQSLFRLDEARKCYEKVLSFAANDACALNNLGVVLREQADLAGSRICFNKILLNNPEDGDARWNLSHSLLISGEWSRGWEEYEWRFRRTTPVPLPVMHRPRWTGDSLVNRRILLCAEQAYGDAIQFVRFASGIAQTAGCVIVECHDSSLAELFRAVPGVSDVVIQGEETPDHDCWCPLLSLPFFLGITMETLPPASPYLLAPAATAARWRQYLEDSAKFRIGLVWSGRKKPDPRRSCPAGLFSPLSCFNDQVDWFSLQIAPEQTEIDTLSKCLNIADLSSKLHDFSETAAAMQHLDLIITIDTSAAHLAGALGRPVWLLLPFAPDWRWLLERSDSPWYPSMRIFRQRTPGDWKQVLESVACALRTLLEERTNPPTAEQCMDKGDAAREIEQWDDAYRHYCAAVALQPDDPLSLLRAGGCLIFLRRPLEAVIFFRRVLSIEPDNIDAHINLALASLTTGDFTTGWKEFEWRLKRMTAPLPPIPLLNSNEAPLEGTHVLVHTEQGFGDTFQFIRYLPILAQYCSQITLSAPEALTRLMKGLGHSIRIVPHGAMLPNADLQAMLMSLPLILEKDSIPSDVPYIVPPADLLEKWKKRLAPYDGLKAGLVWAGRDMRKSGYRRSLDVEDCLTLLPVPGISFFSLQTGERAQEVKNLGTCVTDLSPELHDFAETAAAIMALDLVITVDTSVAHLAGALDKPVWVAMIYWPDWRWLPEKGEATSWYPTMRLFRQPKPGDWAGVMHLIRHELQLLAREQYLNNGLQAYLAGNMAPAQHHYLKALALFPDNPDALFYLGTIALNTGSFSDSESYFRKLLTTEKSPDTLINLGHAIGNQGRHAEAVETFREAAALDPENAPAWLNAGLYLRSGGSLADAEASLLRAVTIKPDYPEAWLNLAMIQQGQGNITDAHVNLKRALSLRPDYATARWNLGLLQLILGEYEEGFKNCESRFHKVGATTSRHSDIRRWRGEAIMDATLLVHAEQGYGDTIQMLRYLPHLKELAGAVIIELQDNSLRSIARTMVDNTVITRSEPRPPADYQIPVMSLPLALKTTLHSIPRQPYIFPVKEKIEHWRDLFADDMNFKIGLVWRGRPLPDPGRSIPAESLASVLHLPGISWYSLQVDPEAQKETLPEIHTGHIHRLTDFAETAACIEALDLIISIDSAIAHLAGAMGKPALILLPFMPDWRWLLGRSDSPWYPTLRLLRQSSPGSWDNVLKSLHDEIRTMAACRNTMGTID